MEADIIVVVSGPSGAQSAKRAIEEGLSVTLLDFGNDEPELTESIPSLPFSTLRRTDPDQRAYFLGSTFGSEIDRNDRLGSHFTAPRAYITKDVDRYSPVESETFFPVQSLALGGLGVGWGAGCQIYEPFELEQAGLPASEMLAYYDEVVRDIGVSGAPEDDVARQIMAPAFMQPPSDIDTNAQSILETYRTERERVRALGLNLGRDPLALLTRPLERAGIRRDANPYTDMDYYGAANKSVYRPKYTIAELQQNQKFRYISGALVQSFTETDDGVTVCFLDHRAGLQQQIVGRKLLLAAGALNSARIALRAANIYDTKLPLLSNPMHYMPCVNLRMLGRPAADRRHSLGQIIGVYTPAHRDPEHVILGTISYRSLLHFRIVRQMPLLPALGVLLSRTLMTSLTMVGVHHPERQSPDKWIELRRRETGDTLYAHYKLSPNEESLIAQDLRGLKRCLWKLRCAPLTTFSTVPGASIHYGGTIPSVPQFGTPPLRSQPSGKIAGTSHVYLADSAGWNSLPAKGLTLTLMANARRIAHGAAVELRAQV